jgi:hypothetical protein
MPDVVQFKGLDMYDEVVTKAALAGRNALKDEILNAIRAQGYWEHPQAGRLRPSQVSNRLFAFCMFAMLCLVVTVWAAQNLRISRWEMEAVSAHLQLASTQQALADTQRQSAGNANDLTTCMTTVERFRSTLNRATADAQQAAPTNSQAANALRLLLILKQLL